VARTPLQEQPDQVSSPFIPFIRGMQEASGLDRAAERLSPLADALVRSPRVRDALRGGWLGHAVHPLLTDLPLGAWMCTTLLDVTGGPESRRAAQRLLGFGLTAAVPTVLTGLAEWQATEGPARRVGAAHANANVVAATLYGLSLLARRRNRHGVGVALGITGGVVTLFSGYLGGHLTLVDKIGTGDRAWYESAADTADAPGPVPNPPSH
jgi:uncharacterized membrane protein